MKEKIIELCIKSGFDKVGFAKLEYFSELETILINQEKKKYKTTFQIGSINDKTFKYNKTYNTAIVVLLSYQSSKEIVNRLKENEVYVSSCSWGEDYHNVIRNKLLVVCDFLKEKGYLSQINVDNNYLDERFLAYKAGLGFYGVNNLLINEDLGSNFFIGVILTDAIVEHDRPIKDKCIKCMKCVESCPTKAINENGILDGNRCLSYITQKKELSKKEEKLIEKCIYGCDICSQVCPYNENKKSNNFKFDDEIIDLNKYISKSNKEFSRKFGNKGFAWRGKNVFERNINLCKEKVKSK